MSDEYKNEEIFKACRIPSKYLCDRPVTAIEALLSIDKSNVVTKINNLLIKSIIEYDEYLSRKWEQMLLKQRLLRRFKMRYLFNDIWCD